MNRSERDQSILDLVSGPGDEAVRAALLDLASLAEAPAPAPTEALAAVFDARPGPQRTRRSPGRIAGGTTAFVGLLVASGTAAAALGGGIPWIDDEPAAPPAAAARPSQPGEPLGSAPYADGTPHARTSPDVTGTVPDPTEPASTRTTGSPTDLPRAGLRDASRERTAATPRRSSAKDGASKGATPTEDSTIPESAEMPELEAESPTVLPTDPVDAGDPAQQVKTAQQVKPAKDAATLKPADRGQGKPAKVAGPPTGKGNPPTDPGAPTTDPAAGTSLAPQAALRAKPGGGHGSGAADESAPGDAGPANDADSADSGPADLAEGARPADPLAQP